MYDSKTYWNNRPNPNKGTEPEHIDGYFIPPFLEGMTQDHLIIEFGVGVGRMFPFYKGLDVVGVDFATQYEAECRKKAIECGLNKYSHLIGNVHERDLPCLDLEFNKGLLIKVLLHAPHKEAITIIKEMGRVCKEVLVISYNGTPEGLAPHCFKHDYKSMLNDLGYKYEAEEIGNQIVISYESN